MRFLVPRHQLPVGFGQARTAKQLPVLTMVCGYSRLASGGVGPDPHRAEDLYAGWWQLIRVGCGAAGAGLGRGGRGRSVARSATELTADVRRSAAPLHAKVLVCKPADPEAKGLVERAHDYLETSFLPGRVFTGPADFNAQLQAWLDTANQRHTARVGCRPGRPGRRLTGAMLPLPPVPPATGWRTSTRLPRDHYVRLDSNDYSVHPSAIGRRVEVIADLDRVRVCCDGRLVADHDRVWAKHQTLTDPDHVDRGQGAAAGSGRRRLRPAGRPRSSSGG